MSKGLLEKKLEEQITALDKSAIVAITDSKGVITYANEMFCQLSKYEICEIIGQTHSLVNSGHHPKSFFVDMWKTILSGEVWRGEVCNRSKNGDLYWVETSIVPFFDENGKPEKFIAIRYDITHRKQTEAELEEEKKRLIESEKLASIGLLSAGLAHELGNPLGAIRGRLEMLKSSVESETFDKDVASKSIDKMLSNIDRISKIIRGLKSYSRDGTNDPKVDFNLSQLLDDILEISREKLKKYGVALIKEGFEETIVVKGRETEIGQVIVNLFNNSYDAVKESDSPWIKVQLIRGEDFLRIQITDSGDGIPEEKINKIFDPFYTTKDVGSGTGLGLSISRSIIENHGGKLDINRDCKNTSFYIDLIESVK